MCKLYFLKYIYIEGRKRRGGQAAIEPHHIHHTHPKTFSNSQTVISTMGRKKGRKKAPESVSLTQAELEEAISRYTHTAERLMRPTLNRAIKRRDKAYEQLTELEESEKALFIVENEGEGLKETRVNIGEEFYVRATVNVEKGLIVDVGCGGFLVDMNLEEAGSFMHERKCWLQGIVRIEQDKIVTLKEQIGEIMKNLKKLEDTTDIDVNVQIISQ